MYAKAMNCVLVLLLHSTPLLLPLEPRTWGQSRGLLVPTKSLTLAARGRLSFNLPI